MEAMRTGWAELRQSSPRELWFMYVLYFFASYTYHAVGTVLAPFATTEFNYSDIQAGALYGTHGLLVSFWHFTLGSTVDALGVKRALMCGFTLSFCGRALLSCATSEWMMLGALFGLGPLGEALAEQTFMVAVCRYTHSGTATFGYSLLYSALNAGGAIAGFIIDLVKTHSVLVLGVTVTGNRLVLISSLFAALACVVGGMFVRDGINVTEPDKDLQLEEWPAGKNEDRDDRGLECGEQETDRLTDTVAAKGKDKGSISFDFKPPETNPAVILTTVTREPNFWRFLALNLMMIFARLPVKYNNSLLPKFLVRLYGRDVPFGSIVSINWVVCIPLTPMFGEWTKEWHHLDAIRLGTFFTGFATIILVCSVSIPVICIWEVTFTLGECFFAARVQAFAAQLAPTGMEATFMAVAGLPSFLSTFPSGLLSGWLLDTFLPICSEVTDFTNADYCDTKAEVLGYEADGVSAGWRCLSPNVCERGSAPRDGSPCVCDVLEVGECNYMCPELQLYGPLDQRSVVVEGVCPAVCADQVGYNGQPRALWMVVLCISAFGPVLITLFLPVLRTNSKQGGPPPPPPVSLVQCCLDLLHKGRLLIARRTGSRGGGGGGGGGGDDDDGEKGGKAYAPVLAGGQSDGEAGE